MADVPAPPRLCVLVVDDYPDARESMAILLGLWGYETHTAPDGQAALALAASTPFDAVLLDLGLPGMDGYAVARRLRELDRGGRLLIICVSGYGQPDDRDRSRAAGCDAHLIKPPDPQELHRLLESCRAGARACSCTDGPP
jgi:CheY-like chemotaxis protein